MQYHSCVLFILFWLLVPGSDSPYPIDGYERTRIPRLAYLQDILDGEVKGVMPRPGARRSIDEIVLNLMGERGDRINIDSLPAVNAQLQNQLDALFQKFNPNYSIAVLDVSPGRDIRYAKRKETAGYQPGSVGKLAVAAGFFAGLEKIHPKDPDKRVALLRNKRVKAGPWALPEHHTIPFYDPETKKYFRRKPVASDEMTLYEWLDHMLSVSSNGAASVVWREAILMHVFGADYENLGGEEADAWFKAAERGELQDITVAVVNQPLLDIGISSEEWRLGSMFTHNAKQLAPGKGGSIGTPVGLIKYLLALEKGSLVDAWSSLEIKRMLYMTDRRIRYASSPALDSAAVYFKSGSFYSCKSGTTCGSYQGSAFNYMNSVAIVEQPDGTTYLVAMMSNVLHKNSAWDHRVLAAGIDKLMREGSILENPESFSAGKLETEN